MKENRFEKVIPIYTGGGIYCFFGIANGEYFIATNDMYDVTIVDSTPFDEDGSIREDVWTADWQDEHLVRYLIGLENYLFFEQMLEWALAQDSIEGGNYDPGDLMAMLDDVHLFLPAPDPICFASAKAVEILKEHLAVEVIADELRRKGSTDMAELKGSVDDVGDLWILAADEDPEDTEEYWPVVRRW